MLFFLMRRGTQRSTRTDTLFPDTTLVRSTGKAVEPCHADTLLSALRPGAGLVTVLDGSPGALSWLGGVRGMRVSPLGTDRFGQTGDLPDLYRTYRLDADAIVEARSEEHTSELQSLMRISYAVFCLKKKNKN